MSRAPIVMLICDNLSTYLASRRWRGSAWDRRQFPGSTCRVWWWWWRARCQWSRRGTRRRRRRWGSPSAGSCTCTDCFGMISRGPPSTAGPSPPFAPRPTRSACHRKRYCMTTPCRLPVKSSRLVWFDVTVDGCYVCTPPVQNANKRVGRHYLFHHSMSYEVVSSSGYVWCDVTARGYYISTPPRHDI